MLCIDYTDGNTNEVIRVEVAIIGAGPTGLIMGIGLARRGHRVVAVDRDPGPSADGSWQRRGVMQFHHAHSFRQQIVDLVRSEAPMGWQNWLAAGAEPVEMALPDGMVVPVGARSRRVTFETALRSAAVTQSGLTIRTGHVDGVIVRRGRASGILVDGQEIDAELVLDASGRSSRVTRSLRTSLPIGGPCGIAYVDRQYQLLDGVPMPPLLNPIAWQGDYDGYQVIIFLHERGAFSALIIRPTSDRSLVPLRHNKSFEAAARAIPGLAAWTDPSVSRPLTDVLPGGPLLNVYRDQRRADGELALPGLVFVGDAVCTTTPNFGRGIATSYLQAGELLSLIDRHGADGESIGEAFDAWCAVNMRPWVQDHVQMDDALARRWGGEDVVMDKVRLPSDLIMAATAKDPSIGAVIGPYLGMLALPSSLDAVEPHARAVYRTGWRPPFTDGPNRHQLAEIASTAVRAGV
jgi:2-polyprenyl-6-methoxyphenol hydroxylase-like FAD-dependent oxidoreductase